MSKVVRRSRDHDVHVRALDIGLHAVRDAAVGDMVPAAEQVGERVGRVDREEGGAAIRTG